MSNCVSIPRYNDFSIFFKMAAVRHLGFSKFFGCQNGQAGEIASSCQILSKSFEPRLRYNDFSIFARWRQPPSWVFDILNFEPSDASRVFDCVNVPYFVIIGQTAAEIRRFFDFYMTPAARCDARFGKTHEGHLVVFVTVQNFV